MTTSEPDRQRDCENIAANGRSSSVINSMKTGNRLSSDMADKGEGHTTSVSTNMQHCSVCGKIRKHVENIPSTRQHEVCHCSDRDLVENNLERSNVKVIGQEKHLKSDSAEINEMSANENTSSMKTEGSEELEPQLDQLESCCVCQNSEIFYTLLPCRHACVCSTCIKHLDKCPICRSSIEAYFRLHNRLSEQEPRENMEQTAAGPRLNRWQAFNQRLNEWFGFV